MRDREIAITAEGLSKCYRIGLKEEIRDSLVQAMFDIIRKPISNYRKYRSLYKFDDLHSEADANDIIWALRDVSFEVLAGEKIGIIGRNGSGKSTLLKVLSRITQPAQGRAIIHGRTSSLLEVGTGFHQELTGRENVYLNGTILGMKKREIDQKFDEIVEFSGVEKFLDTPVKRYSSGMRVRLAFSVAAHLEPEILIIDEVLAVGDTEFQNKCLSKMEEVGKSGRTIFFVSHNMAAILQLCDRVLWLENGRIRKDGSAEAVVTSYLEAGTESHAIWRRADDDNNKRYLRSHKGKKKYIRELKEEKGYSAIEIIAACLIQPNLSEPATVIPFSSEFDVRILYQIKQPLEQDMHIATLIDDLKGNRIFTSWDTDTIVSADWKARKKEPGWYLSVCQIPPCLLRPGRYLVSVAIYLQNTYEWELYERILTFNVSEVGYMEFDPDRRGIITPPLKWEINKVEDKADIADYNKPSKLIAAK